MKNFVLEGPGGIPGLQQTRQSGGLAITNSNWQFNGTVSLTGGLGATTITASSATAFVVGQNGTTNPAFDIDTSTASSATGLKLTSKAAAAGVAVVVTSSGTNENLTIDAKGSGTIAIGTVSTGQVQFGKAGTFGQLAAGFNTAPTAGGSLNGLVISSTANFGLFVGSGAPTINAMNGSIYLNIAATTTTTRLYINNSGASTAGTTWTTFTAAA